jgi:hypothetical protein
MSHLAKIELEVKDLDVLSLSCRHLGLTLVQGKKTFQWFNGESACDHAIEVPGATYEIGLVLNDGKYELQTDFFDKGIESAIGKNGGLLKQRYAVEQTISQAKKQGCRVIEKKTKTGIRLHVRM